MNYYIFTYTNNNRFSECPICEKHYRLVKNRIHGEINTTGSDCPSCALDYLYNIFVSDKDKNITNQPLAPCLCTYYINDSIYKLLL